MTPVMPPSRNRYRNPIAHSIGVSKVRCPRHIVAIQLKNLIPVGTAMANDGEAEEREVDRAGREHVMGPDRHREAGDRHRRQDERSDTRTPACG